MNRALAAPPVQAGREVYCNLDLLRGLAALSILVWHYQSFYYTFSSVPFFYRPFQPLYTDLTWLYEYGFVAVQFFWALSGFIFFHIYGPQRSIGGWEFFVNRFARLYPLHLITLLLVAALQWVSVRTLGTYQIYRLNDLRHFLLNLGMASYWGFQDGLTNGHEGFSFNGPIWSVSVEVLVYVMFFVHLKSFGVRLTTGIAFLAWSLLFFRITGYNIVFECATLFALGGLIKLVHTRLAERFAPLCSTACALGWLLVSYLLLKSNSLTLLSAIEWGFLPGLVWLAAALERQGLSSGWLGLQLGSLSYSSYLIHVPIQICLLLYLDLVLKSRAILSSPFFLGGFVLLVIVLALLVNRLVEVPLNRQLRFWLLPRVRVERQRTLELTAAPRSP